MLKESIQLCLSWVFMKLKSFWALSKPLRTALFILEIEFSGVKIVKHSFQILLYFLRPYKWETKDWLIIYLQYLCYASVLKHGVFFQWNYKFHDLNLWLPLSTTAYQETANNIKNNFHNFNRYGITKVFTGAGNQWVLAMFGHPCLPSIDPWARRPLVSNVPSLLH